MPDTLTSHLVNTSNPHSPTAAQVGAVPTSRTVNGHALSADVTVTKSDVGLGSVENTALSTWAGSSSVTTVGTIGTGTWQGTQVGVGYGGTGLTSAGANGTVLESSGSAPQWKTLINTMLFGNGADGNVAFDGSSSVTIAGASISPVGGVYTLTGDANIQTATFSGSAAVKTVGFRFLAWEVVSACELRDDGTAASGGAAGGGLAAAGTTQRFSSAGAAGPSAAGAGGAGTALTAAMGGRGGTGGTATSAGGAGGTLTAPAATSGNPHTSPAVYLTGRLLGAATGYGGGSGGGAGGFASGATGNAGGGGGGGGVILAAVYRVTGSFVAKARGATGGNGTGTGNLGGGGGGGGGYVCILWGVGNTPTSDVSGGAGGNGLGTGTAGSTGSAGVSKIIQVVV